MYIVYILGQLDVFEKICYMLMPSLKKKNKTNKYVFQSHNENVNGPLDTPLILHVH